MEIAVCTPPWAGTRVHAHIPLLPLEVSPAPRQEKTLPSSAHETSRLHLRVHSDSAEVPEDSDNTGIWAHFGRLNCAASPKMCPQRCVCNEGHTQTTPRPGNGQGRAMASGEVPTVGREVILWDATSCEWQEWATGPGSSDQFCFCLTEPLRNTLE